MAHEAEHRVLDQIERFLAMSRRKFGHAQRAAFNLAQESLDRARIVDGGHSHCGHTFGVAHETGINKHSAAAFRGSFAAG